MTSVWGPETDFGLSSEQMLEEMHVHLWRHLGEYQIAFTDAEGWSGASKEDGPPVDVLVIPPEGERRFAYVCSFGGSFRPLPAENYAAAGERRRVEFVLAAQQSGDPDKDRDALNLAANTVRQFAKLVHLNPITVEPGETVAFSEDPAPLFETGELVAFAFMRPRLPANGFHVFSPEAGERVWFVSPTPITRAELEYARKAGPQALAAALERADVTEMVDLGRRSAPLTPQCTVPQKRSWIDRLLDLVGIR